MKLYLPGFLFITFSLVRRFSASAAVVHEKHSAGRLHGERARLKEPDEEADDDGDEATQIANQVEDTQAGAVKVDADNARQAADVAKEAAVVANNVAEHSIKVHHHAQSALKHALGALHTARTESANLDGNQKDSLKKAEAKLREATQKADYGDLKQVQSAEDVEKAKMKKELGKEKNAQTELEQMRVDIQELRKTLQEKGGDKETENQLSDLESDIDDLEKDNKTEGNDEMKAEIERLRDVIEGKQGRPNPLAQEDSEDGGEYMKDVQMKPLEGSRGTKASASAYEQTPIEDKGIDIDTELPYGDLEPFGREDTAQELTESSVRESDAMVDQLERAEVAEEKRAVFRALTRLRGAAITSFDGVARAQTGNIDEYNKVHKWRKTHPMHHLADEESDITKWAFPSNADFLQKNYTVLNTSRIEVHNTSFR
jgi:hypothetical protein